MAISTERSIFTSTLIKYGIKPIIGCELYVAPKSRFDKTGYGIGETPHHLIVLARNMQGYRNLMKLSTAGFLDGFYYRPRIDKELLANIHDGLIGMSACLHGEIARPISSVAIVKKAARSARQYRNIFGEENFFIEIMENGLPGSEKGKPRFDWNSAGSMDFPWLRPTTVII